MLLRMGLVVEQEELRRDVRSRLRGSDILVISLDLANGLAPLGRSAWDILVLSEVSLGGMLEDALTVVSQLPDFPALVLLGHVPDERRAQLAGEGCDAIFDPSTSPDILCDAIESIAERRKSEIAGRTGRGFAFDTPRLGDFVSTSPAMHELMSLAHRVTLTDTSLLIMGETGVGKERLAMAIHAESQRSEEPFVPINCAALPDALLESELFGHEQGAFTGATRTRRGAFELAHRGTIFLDEIGDMPLVLQVKLLRVLQSCSFMKLGGESPISVDVRIMAATNRDLAEEVSHGRFRRDLFYRLSVVSLLIPPLRVRHEDVAELVHSYIDYLSPRVGVTVEGIGPEALEALLNYDWPGNVRELINILERAMLITDSDTIGLSDLPEELSSARGTGARAAACTSDIVRSDDDVRTKPEPWQAIRNRLLDEGERRYLHSLLGYTHGRLKDAAALAGYSQRALHAKMKRHGLRKESFKLK